MHSTESIRKQEFAESLPRASIQDLGIILMGAGYEVYFCFYFISPVYMRSMPLLIFAFATSKHVLFAVS